MGAKYFTRVNIVRFGNVATEVFDEEREQTLFLQKA